MDFSEIYKRVENSVVQIGCGSLNEHGVFVLTTTGTGVVVSNRKYILTCAHCVSNEDIIVLLEDENVIAELKVKIKHVNKDFAVLKVGRVFKAPKVVSPAQIGSSDNLVIGNECFTIGYPISTRGKKSFLSAHIARKDPDHLTIDCPINHGNSGGPLFNIEGKLVGIVSTKSAGLGQDLMEDIKRRSVGNRLQIDGIDAIESMCQIIENMQSNLNLGVGGVIKIETIKDSTPYVY